MIVNPTPVRFSDGAAIPASDEQARKVSYWDALVAEGFVPARVSKRVIVAEGQPEVPLTRYRPERSVKPR